MLASLLNDKVGGFEDLKVWWALKKSEHTVNYAIR